VEPTYNFRRLLYRIIYFGKGEKTLANKILKIEGITCAACAKAVERAAK
jgi:hypothetical protein